MTYNAEGIERNIVCTTTLMALNDIMCIQEHHLHEFEKSKLQEMFPDYSCDAKSYDQISLLDPSHKPAAGRGGVATLWKRQLDPHVTRSPKEGNERILVVTFETPGNKPICIINCYLPSGNAAAAIELFLEDIDLLNELLYKYKTTCQVLLLGDLNVDHHNRNHLKEIKMKQLIKEHNLKELCLEAGHEKTYINPNLGHASHIDHILTTGDSQNCSPAEIMTDDVSLVCNMSTHRPLRSTITLVNSVKLPQPTKKKKSSTVSYPVKKMDVVTYNETLDQELKRFDMSLINHKYSTAIFQQCMQTAIISSTPASEKPSNGSRKNKSKWTPELKKAESISKAEFFKWKMAGRPKEPHPTQITMIQAKKNVKSIIRKEKKNALSKRLLNLSEASENDQKLLHELIKLQDSTSSASDSLIIDGKIITDEDEIRKHWAEYFEKLGTPSNTCEEDDKLVNEIRALCNEDDNIIDITPELVLEAIKRLNSGKAKDIYGLAAEHLKSISDSSLRLLTDILSSIINHGKVPDILKASYKINIPKKNKDPRYQDHHRGITVAPIISKLLETLADILGLEALPQNKLQFGFSYGRSPSMCSLIISEASSESRATKVPLGTAAEDARKAFDVVDHNLLKIKLYHAEVPKKVWSLIDDLYTGGTEQFRYKGELSAPYTIRQGVKQGAVDSPPLYKFYIYDLLKQLEEKSLGLHIGPIYLGTPTCADDIELLSNDKSGRELQRMLSTTKTYSERHKYEIHPTKSTATIMYETKNIAFERREWFLSDKPMPLNDEFDHLGLTWMSGKTKPDLQAHISSARRTSYRLMGAGFHGVEGLNPVISMRLIKCYVIPRLLLGLDAIVLNNSDVMLLDKYYKKLLKQLQSLPDSTANVATYLLIGSIPIAGEWHKRVLSLYGRITRLGKDHPLYLLAARQLSLGEKNRPNSWFTQAAKIGDTYGICVHEALKTPWNKELWKQRVRNAVDSYWKIMMLQESQQKSTLKWLIHTAEDTPNGVWESCRMSPHLAAAAATRARALVGRLCINEHSWRESNTCPLCEHPAETMTHFLLECTELESIRTAPISRLLQFYSEENLPLPQTPDEKTSAILNGDRYCSSSTITSLRKNNKDAHNLSSSLCHRLLKERDYIINDKLMELC